MKNQFKLATLSPEKYYAWVNDQNSSEQIEYLSESYGDFVDFMSTSSQRGLNSKLDITYTMSDGLKTLAKSTLGDSEEFTNFIDNFNTFSVSLDESLFNGYLGMNMGIDFNTIDLADVNLYMDYANLFMMARIPQITETYLGIDYMSYNIDFADDEDFEILSKFYSDPESVLTKDEFESLAEKYISLWNDCVSEVEQEKKQSISVGEYTNEYTVMTVDLNQDFLDNTARKYIDTLKEDEIIKDIFVTRLAVYTEDEYISTLDDILENIKTDIEYEDDLTLVTYVDQKGTIRGYSLKDTENAGFEVLFAGESEEKANGIFTYSDGDEVEVNCDINYVADNNKYTGQAVFNINDYGDETKTVVDFSNLEMVNDKYGYLDGYISVTVDDDTPFEFNLSSDGSSQNINFDIDIQDVNYGNIDIEISANEISDLEIPNKNDAFSLDLNSPDFTGYATNDDVIEFIASIIKNLGLVETQEEAEQIVNYYLYGSMYY